MYPELFGISTQWILISIGIITALILFRFFSVKYKMSDAAFKLYGLISIAAIVGGFVFAILFQMVYDAIEGGGLQYSMTFMGGLVGAVLTFVVLMLIFAKGSIKKEFWSMVCIAPACIAAAHCLGRIGCFFNGCCYGVKLSHGGVNFPFHGGENRLPTQLIEAVFLALLCGALILTVLKFKRYSLAPIIYLFAYSVFRFTLEFWRADDRGGAGALSPSQWQSIFMFLGGMALSIYIFGFKRIPLNGKQEGDLSGFLIEKK